MDFITQVGDCFLHDDGSLPDLELGGLTGREIAEIYGFLFSRSRVSTVEPTFWDRIEECDVPVDSVPNAAEWVTSGRAGCFHVCLEGLHVDGFELPELGVFVFTDAIALDYRMGPGWTEETIRAFFGLLFLLTRMAPTSTLGPGPDGVANPGAFLEAWEDYLLERTSGIERKN